MSTNTHISTAKFRQEGVHEWQIREGDTEATNLAAALDAQTEATLALAYEQRTANMIAYWAAMTDESLGYLDVEDKAQFRGIQEQITERLDLA